MYCWINSFDRPFFQLLLGEGVAAVKKQSHAFLFCASLAMSCVMKTVLPISRNAGDAVMQIFSCSQYLSGVLSKDVLNKRQKIRLLCFVREILFAAEAVDTFACLRSHHIAVFNCNKVDMVCHAVWIVDGRRLFCVHL